MTVSVSEFVSPGFQCEKCTNAETLFLSRENGECFGFCQCVLLSDVMYCLVQTVLHGLTRVESFRSNCLLRCENNSPANYGNDQFLSFYSINVLLEIFSQPAVFSWMNNIYLMIFALSFFFSPPCCISVMMLVRFYVGISLQKQKILALLEQEEAVYSLT